MVVHGTILKVIFFRYNGLHKQKIVGLGYNAFYSLMCGYATVVQSVYFEQKYSLNQEMICLTNNGINQNLLMYTRTT